MNARNPPADPMADHEPGFANGAQPKAAVDPNDPAQKLAEQNRRQQQLKKNIERIRTPVQKLQAIPMLRLDEGVLDSIKQQFIGMCVKISYVLVPRYDSNTSRIRNWDLWGPFFMIVLFAFFIDNSTQMLMLFFSVFVGAFIVTFNVVALGGKVSFFQSFSILSYCIFPIFMSIMINRLLRFFQVKSRAFTVIFLAICVLWSIVSVGIFIGANVSENKRFVSVYPAALYYIFIGILLAFN